MKIAGKLKAWLREAAAVRTVNNNLPQGVRARRNGKAIEVEGHGLSYKLDRSKFSSADEMAAYAKSKFPVA